MKKVFILLFLFSNMSFGQVLPKDPLNKQYFPDLKELLKLRGLDQQRRGENFSPENGIQKVYDWYANQLGATFQGKFSYSVTNGSVYAISPDQMPDLVPETAGLERMPIKMLTANIDRMPVSGPQIKWIPKVPSLH
jgi:hypothetical protein